MVRLSLHNVLPHPLRASNHTVEPVTCHHASPNHQMSFQAAQIQRAPLDAKCFCLVAVLRNSHLNKGYGDQSWRIVPHDHHSLTISKQYAVILNLKELSAAQRRNHDYKYWNTTTFLVKHHKPELNSVQNANHFFTANDKQIGKVATIYGPRH